MGSTLAATASPPLQARPKGRANGGKNAPRRLTLEQFREKYTDREDGFKYEYNNGLIEKTPSSMNPRQLFIVKNLTRRFLQTTAFAAGDELSPEVDQLTAAAQQHRPDLSYWTAERIRSADETVSPFVIEIISPTDNYLKVNQKLREYFRGGVRVIWQIVPEEETVYVFTSPTLVTICEGDTVCSAAPVVPDFQMPARAIFAR